MRQAGEHSGQVWKRNHKPGPKKFLRGILTLRWLSFPWKKSKCCTWDSSHKEKLHY